MVNREEIARSCLLGLSVRLPLTWWMPRAAEGSAGLIIEGLLLRGKGGWSKN